MRCEIRLTKSVLLDSYAKYLGLIISFRILPRSDKCMHSYTVIAQDLLSCSSCSKVLERLEIDTAFISSFWFKY